MTEVEDLNGASSRRQGRVPMKCVAGLMLVVLPVLNGAFANGQSGVESAVTAKASIVKDAPFSADVITQYDRTLNNGGRIHRETRGKVYRDSQGRMRTENQPPSVQPGSDRYDHIIINDPVQQVIIHLNPKNKTATIYRFGDFGVAPIVSAKQAKPKDKSTLRVGGQAGISSGPADTLLVPKVPAERASMPASPQTRAQGMSASRTERMNYGSATIVPLGTKYIEGENATGTRTTRVIPADIMGNDAAIVSISDAWVSSDLKVTVLTETDDGQAGHSTMRLVDIVRAEPSAKLFQVPADYMIREGASATAKH